jgi:5-methylcytosine-specific restriction endonuclease McrA
LPYIDNRALDLPYNARLGPLCKNSHSWNGHQFTLRIKGKCLDCERIRKRNLSIEQRERLQTKARERYKLNYDPIKQKQKHEANKARMLADSKFAEHIRNQRRRLKEQARRRQGIKPLPPLEIMQLQKAIRKAGRLPSVAKLVADEQRRYWLTNQEAKREALAESARIRWHFNYISNSDLRLYHREKSRRRKLQQKKQTAWKISVLQLRARFCKFHNACAYCGSTVQIQIEHVIPISKGGIHHINNIVPACKICNYSKAAHSVEQWYRSQPFFDPTRLNLILSLTQKPQPKQLVFQMHQ